MSCPTAMGSHTKTFNYPVMGHWGESQDVLDYQYPQREVNLSESNGKTCLVANINKWN